MRDQLIREENSSIINKSKKNKKKIKYSVIAVLLTIVIIVVCITSRSKTPVTPVSITTKSCANVSDGLIRLSRAVDITKLELLPISSASISAGFGRTLFEFTCNKGKRWTDPLTSIIYDLPDQVEAINSLSSGIFDTYSTIYESFEEVKMDIAAGANVNYKEGMFSASASYRHAQQLMANNSKYVAETTSYFSAFQADIGPYWTTAPGKNFLNFVKYQLPKTYDENPEKYEELFREYGTHYFTGGQFGGLFRMSITLDEKLRTKMSDINIRIAINATILDYLKGFGAYSDDNFEVNSEFQSLSQVTVRYYGGNVPIEGPAEWDKWSKSVPKNPWLFSGYLSPITNLIPDGDGKKDSARLAMETYLAIAYLKDMVINLNYYLKRNNIKETNNKTATNFIRESEIILSKIPVDALAAKSLALEVKQFLFENQPPPPEMMSDYGIANIVVLSAVITDHRLLLKPDPFVKVYAAGIYIGQTSIKSGTNRPSWNNLFRSPRIHLSSIIRFDIYDEKWTGDEFLGSTSITVKDILRRDLNATETSLFPHDLYVKITWLPEYLKPIN